MKKYWIFVYLSHFEVVSIFNCLNRSNRKKNDVTSFKNIVWLEETLQLSFPVVCSLNNYPNRNAFELFLKIVNSRILLVFFSSFFLLFFFCQFFNFYAFYKLLQKISAFSDKIWLDFCYFLLVFPIIIILLRVDI